MSKSELGGVRRVYEAPRARIVAVGPGCVVRASDGYWTAAPFAAPVDGDWGYDDGNTTAAAFENPFNGLWCDESNSSSAAKFDVVVPGEWGGDGGSSAGVFGKVEGSW